MSRRLEFIAFTAVVTIYMAWFTWPLLWATSDNLRLISLFESDEAIWVEILKKAIDQRTFRIDWYSFGHVYFNVSLLPLFVMSIFTQVSEQHVIVVLRIVSALFGIATIGATFFLARRYFGRLAAWLAAFFLSIIPLNFLHWCAHARPDVPQMFFLVAGVYFCCRLVEEKHLKWLSWASVFAGLAFATKYSGLFLLPIIWTVAVAQTIRKNEGHRKIEGQSIKATQAIRYVVTGVGMLCIITGIVFTPDFALRHLTVDGTIDVPQLLALINPMRISAIVSGLALAGVTISGRIWSTVCRSPRLGSGVGKIGLSIVSFVGAFFLTSPFSFVRLNFIKGMFFESRHTSFGPWFEEVSSGSVWFRVLLSPQLLSGIIAGLAAVSLILFLWHLLRDGWDRLLSPEGVFWMWVVLFMSFLVFRVKLRPPRYLLPIIPFLIILSTRPISLAIEYVRRKATVKVAVLFAIGLVICIGVLEVPKSFSLVAEHRKAVIGRKGTERIRSLLEVGQWLEERYSSSTRILYDHFSYVPPSFPNAVETWGGTLELLEKVGPDVVVVNKGIARKFLDRSRATSYFAGKRAYNKISDYYRSLDTEKVGYVLVRDFGGTQVYEKQ